jgi:hypothetical protein
MSNVQGKVLDAVQHVVWIVNLRKQLQAADNPADSLLFVTDVNDSGEHLPALSATHGFRQQVAVVTERSSQQCHGPFEQLRGESGRFQARHRRPLPPDSVALAQHADQHAENL